jgi:hypothetical protein
VLAKMCLEYGNSCRNQSKAHKGRVCRIGEVHHHSKLVNDFESTRRRSGPRLGSRSDMMSPLGTGIKAA